MDDFKKIKMKISTLLLFVLSCLMVLEVSAKKGKKATQSPEKLGQAKLEMIQKLEKESSDGVIMITPAQYLELVQQNPRPYDIVMLWNVPPGRCEHCIQVSAEFR